MTDSAMKSVQMKSAQDMMKTKHLITQEVHHIMQCVTHNVERILRHGKCIPHSESYATHNENCKYNEKYITNNDTCASPDETMI